MEKELQILSGAILTMLLYGIFLLLDGKPFLIYPLSTLVNFGMTATIIILLRKFDWRNLVYLFTATILLFQDPLFMSFFDVELSSYGIEHKTNLSLVLIILSNIFLFLPLVEFSKWRFLTIVLITCLAIGMFLFVGVYGMFLTSILACIYTVTSKVKEVEFLKVYNMFFVFMLINQVGAHVLYGV